MTAAGFELSYEPLEPRHAQELYPGFTEAAIARFIPGTNPASLRALRKQFAKFSAGPPPGSRETWMNWVIRDVRAGGLVGALQATAAANGELWIGYKIIGAAVGRGIATVAVKWLLSELAARYAGREVWAAADTRNLASLRVLEKCGFQLVRTEPADIRGEPTLDHVYKYVP